MKKEEVIVFVVVVIMAICAIFIATAPKTQDDIHEISSMSDTSAEPSSNDTDTTVAETEEESEFALDDIFIGTIEKAAVTGMQAPIIDEFEGAPTTTQKHTYTTERTTNYLTTQITNCMTDEDYLATAIFKEAGADYVSNETRQYVAEVILNRVASDKFPNTIYGVLTQYRQYGTFYKTGVPLLDYESAGVDRAYRIANSVLNGKRDVPSNVVYQAEFPQGSGVWKYIDGIFFCYA